MMRFAYGKMSSRKGNVITGESLLMDLTDEAKIKMRERDLKNADAISPSKLLSAPLNIPCSNRGAAKILSSTPSARCRLRATRDRICSMRIRGGCLFCSSGGKGRHRSERG